VIRRICDVCGEEADNKYVGTSLLKYLKFYFKNENFDMCSSCGEFIEEVIVQNIKEKYKEAKEKEVKR